MTSEISDTLARGGEEYASQQDNLRFFEIGTLKQNNALENAESLVRTSLRGPMDSKACGIDRGAERIAASHLFSTKV